MSHDHIFLSLNISLIVQTAVWSGRRDHLGVRILRCGRFEKKKSWSRHTKISFNALYNKSNLFLNLSYIFYPFVSFYYNFLILTVGLPEYL